MSDGTFPLQNRPVGIPPIKSWPYGEKLHRADVIKLLLLLPVSMIESPNTNTAGTEIFGGSFTAPFVLLLETTSNSTVKRTSDFKVEARKQCAGSFIERTVVLALFCFFDLSKLKLCITPYLYFKSFIQLYQTIYLIYCNVNN